MTNFQNLTVQLKDNQAKMQKVKQDVEAATKILADNQLTYTQMSQ